MNWKCVLKEAGKLFAIVSALLGYVFIFAYLTTLESILSQVIGWVFLSVPFIVLFIYAGMDICRKKNKLFNDEDDV